MRSWILLVLLMLVGCSDSLTNVTGPNDSSSSGANPSSPASGSTVLNANWIGDATVITASGSGGCGWGRTAGETRSGVLWRVVINSTAVSLDEDMANWPTDDIPFSGTLDGLQFTAQYTQQPAGPCLFAGGTLSGTFAEDFSTFTANEILHWGEGTTRTTVQRQWQVRKR